MIRFLLFLVGIAALAALAAWAADHPGRLVIDWQNYRIETSATLALFLVCAFAVCTAAIYRVWILIWRGSKTFSSSRREQRQRRGYAALTQGLIAIANGDASIAQKLAGQTAKLLDDPAPVLLLMAQAAELANQMPMAEAAYQRMLKRPEMEFLGLRGLIGIAVRKGDRSKALDLARRAAALKPNAPWLLRERLALEAGSGDWVAATATLRQGVRQGAILANNGRYQGAVILLERARQAAQAGNTPEALKQALAAAKAAPQFAPAQAEAAQFLQAQGQLRKAIRLLERAWAARPHPLIGETYLRFSGRTPLQSAQILHRLQPEHPESQALLVETLLQNGQTKAVVPLLTSLRAKEGDTSRVCRFMAAVERADWGESAAAHDWMVKAAAAAPSGRWHCQSCGVNTLEWTPHCPDCQAFASLDWRQAELGATSALAQSAAPPYGPPAAPAGAGLTRSNIAAKWASTP